jgi:flagellar motor switch protein FliM
MNDISVNGLKNSTAADPWLRMLDELADEVSNSRNLSILNDDEIDQLMGFPSAADRRKGKGAIADTSYITSGFSPAIRLVSENFVDALSRRMRQFVTGTVDISLVDLTLIKLSIGLGSLPLPSLIAVIHSQSLAGSGIAVIDAPLAGAFFDNLLGGGQAQPRDLFPTRPFSSLELHLYRKFADTVAAAFAEGFGEIAKLDFNVDRIETSSRNLRLGQPTDNAIRLRVQIHVGRRGGVLDIILPLGIFGDLEPLIRPKDEAVGTAGEAEWRQHLVSSVAKSSVGLEVVLAEFRLPLRQVLGFAVGQTFPLAMEANGTVALQCGGIRLASGVMGRSRDHMATRLLGSVGSKSVREKT